MNKIILTFLLSLLLFVACSKTREHPLTLPTGAEPSAKMHNDQGIEHFIAGRDKEALIKFTQASVADSTTGEIHFNIALAYHQRGEQGKAIAHFKLAAKYARGNPDILKSPLLNKLIQ